MAMAHYRTALAASVVLLCLLDAAMKLVMSSKRIGLFGGDVGAGKKNSAFERLHTKQLLTSEWTGGPAVLMLLLAWRCPYYVLSYAAAASVAFVGCRTVVRGAE